MAYNGKTDWKYGDTVTENDMNRIEQGIIDATNEIENIQPASLTEAGITKLSSATNSTSESEAATPKAVKAAYDLANSGQIVRGDAPSNWNNATQNGLYRVAVPDISTYTNAPSGAYGYGVLEVIYGVTAGAATVQRYQTHDGHLYYRTAFAGGNWSAWKEIFTTSGGTIYGDVSINGEALVYKSADTDNRWQSAHVEVRNPGSSSLTNMPRIALHSEGAGVAKQIAGDHIRGGVSVLNENGDALDNFNCKELRFEINGVKHTTTELFQSGVDYKNKIAGAINSKNGSASASMTADQMAAAITNLSTTLAWMGVNGYSTQSSQGSPVYYTLFTFPANRGKVITFVPDLNMFYLSASTSGTSSFSSYSRIEFVDNGGVTITVLDVSRPANSGAAQKYATGFVFDGNSRVLRVTDTTSGTQQYTLPTNFNVNGQIVLRAVFGRGNEAFTGQGSHSMNFQGNLSYM